MQFNKPTSKICLGILCLLLHFGAVGLPQSIGAIFFMPRFNDLTGKQFSNLTVLSPVGVRNGRHYFQCLCACGKMVEVPGSGLSNGHNKSCGCLRTERISKIKFSHGDAGKPEYMIFQSIMARCTNPNNAAFDNYGGRGIKVCDQWLNNYTNFISDMGKRPSPSHSIDRRDNDKGYSPENCRWATLKEQANNKRTNRIITYNGESLTLSQWSDRIHIGAPTLSRRLALGWSDEKTILTKLKITNGK